MKRSNSKEVRQKVRQYIFDCIHDYDQAYQVKTHKEALNLLWSEFDRVANYADEKIRYPFEQTRFFNYLEGMPFMFRSEYWMVRPIVSEWLESDSEKYTDEQAYHMYKYLIYSETKKAIEQ